MTKSTDVLTAGYQIAQGLGEGIGLRLDKANDCIYVADMAGRLVSFALLCRSMLVFFFGGMGN